MANTQTAMSVAHQVSILASAAAATQSHSWRSRQLICDRVVTDGAFRSDKRRDRRDAVQGSCKDSVHTCNSTQQLGKHETFVRALSNLAFFPDTRTLRSNSV
ncbi:hypothetical protein CLAIMM_00596, partial [Cladophialophora immunda]